MRVFSPDNGHFVFLIYLIYGVTLLDVVEVKKNISEVFKICECESRVIDTEDINMNRQKIPNKGTHTPPTPVLMSALHPTRIPVPVTVSTNAGAYDSNQETSNILSKANEVLYMTPNTIYPTQPMSVQYTPETQFTASQGKYQPNTTITTNTTTVPTTGVYNTTNKRGSVPGSDAPENFGIPTTMDLGGVAPLWLSQLFQNLESRLLHIDTQLSNQNSRWQNMDRALQTQSVTLQNQDTRMLNIEQQMSEINGLKNNVTRIEVKMNALESDLHQTNITMSEYQRSIDTYSDLCDQITRDKETNDSVIDDLSRRVAQIESDQSSLRSNQRKSENTLTDLQCRSMRDNLIFTGISEVTLKEGEEYEDAQKSLNKFLEEEMGIFKIIEFHRVHRMGAYDKDSAKESPRPIIAKFEKFKDREYVRSLAKDTLKGKRFGIREQYPKVIEEKRKMLYPVAKEARKIKDNKVRLVRDRLFVNNEEILVAPNEKDESRTDNTRRKQDIRTSTRNAWQNSNSERSYRGDRVFYRGKGSRNRYVAPSPGTTGTTKSVDFSVPVSNSFSALAWGSDTPMRQNIGNTSTGRKHPASSPLDDDYTMKKHREGSESDEESEMLSSPHPIPAEHTTEDRSTTHKSAECTGIESDLEIENNGQNDDSQIPESAIRELLKPAIVVATLAASLQSDDGLSKNDSGANETSAHDSENQNGDVNSETA